MCGLVIGAILLGVLGCGSSGEGKLIGMTLDRAVQGIPEAASSEEVEQRLGPPESRSPGGQGEWAYQYGAWRLYFVDDLLDRKAKEVWLGHGRTEQTSKELDADVLALRRGMSIAEVRVRLGAPLSYERVYSGNTAQATEIVLRYGGWLLAFTDRHLDRRTKY